MDFRDIVVWLGLIAIAVIVWDGLRRMKQGKPKNKLKTKAKAKQEPKDDYIDPEEAKKKAEIARELPNGGARTREMTDTEKSEISTRLNLRERVPMLMERVEVKEPEPQEETSQADEHVQPELDFTLAMADPERTDETANQEAKLTTSDESDLDSVNERHATEIPAHTDSTIESPVSDNDDAAFDTSALANSSGTEEFNQEKEIQESAIKDDVGSPIYEASTKPTEVSAKPAEPENNSIKADVESIDPGPVEDLVVIHVMANKGEELSGSAVLDLLITAGLRHGPMDIFHYRNPKGVTEFSLANCVHPGTFDPDGMNQVNTPGVTIFMQLPTAADSMESFDHMYEMAQFLSKHLSANILDEDHSSVTPQRIEYYREKLRTFERSKLIPS